jgi:hypothetical protein
MCRIRVSPTWKSHTDGRTDFRGENGLLHDVLVNFAKHVPEGNRRLLDANDNVYRYLAVFLDGERIPHDRLRVTSVAEGNVIEIVPPLTGG